MCIPSTIIAIMDPCKQYEGECSKIKWFRPKFNALILTV